MAETINKDKYDVIVSKAPISERYWHAGCHATVNGNKILCGGAWFDFDAHWVVKKAK